MNVWTDPNKAFSQLERGVNILLILLDCPPRSADPARAGLVRNWRLLKAFAEASGTPTVHMGRARRIGPFMDFLGLGEEARHRHLVIAGRTQGGSMLPIMLEAALLGLQVSIVHDAFLDGRFARAAVMPTVSRRPLGNAPLYVATSQVLASMLAELNVDEPPP